MATFIQKPTIIQAAGQPPKSIEEFIGRVNSGTAAVSIARMKSPSGWSEPGQTPEFDEYTVVLRGSLHVKLKDAEYDVAAGQAIIVKAGEWVQYSSPSPKVPSTSPCAFRHFRPKPCIGSKAMPSAIFVILGAISGSPGRGPRCHRCPCPEIAAFARTACDVPHGSPIPDVPRHRPGLGRAAGTVSAEPMVRWCRVGMLVGIILFSGLLYRLVGNRATNLRVSGAGRRGGFHHRLGADGDWGVGVPVERTGRRIATAADIRTEIGLGCGIYVWPSWAWAWAPSGSTRSKIRRTAANTSAGD